jgi:hypothetical protein
MLGVGALVDKGALSPQLRMISALPTTDRMPHQGSIQL